MAVEAFTAIVVGLVIGAVGGAFSAFLGWIKSGDVFEAKKFTLGVVTGIIAGVILVVGLSGQIEAATTNQGLLMVYIGIILAIIGADQLRTSVSGAVANRESKETKAKQVEQK